MIKSAGELISEAQNQINCIDVATAKSIHETSSDVLIIDVREAHSAAESKLQHSINISRGLLEMNISKHCSNVDTVILTHCGGGGRASLAALSLQQMGYRKVYAITARYEDIKTAFG